MQGSGTFAVEAVLSSSIPKSQGKVLVIANGAYGKRLESIIRRFDGVAYETLSFPDDRPVCKEVVQKVSDRVTPL